MRRRSPGVQAAEHGLGPELWPAEWSAEHIVKVLEPLVLPERSARLRHIFGLRLENVTVLMDAPHDPHNGAAVVRSCEAFGLTRLHVIATREPFLIARSVARGAEHWVEVHSHSTARAALSILRGAGYELIGSHPQGQLLPQDLASIPRCALVLGNERDGIGAEVQSAIRRSVRIAMRGFVESLNLSVAAAILLNAATAGRAGDLCEQSWLRLYARGLWRSIPRAREIVAALR